MNYELYMISINKGADHLHREGKDDGAVVLCRDAV